MGTLSASMPEHLWVKMFWAIVLYLGLILVPVLFVMLVLHKTAGEMVGPYVAFALPGPIFLLVSMWLRVWEDRGASPRRLALAWSICILLFMFVGLGATFYSGVELHLINLQDAVGGFVVACVAGALIVPFMMYRWVLKVTAARADKRKGPIHQD